jgi:glycosyltransferase involved in cell wall biosynthesis
MGTAPPDFSPGTAVVLVSHNTRELLLAALASVVQDASEAVVVDNGSTDGSAAAVRRAFPGVEVLENAHNPGYGAAANQGIAACSAPFVLLLNSDTMVRPGALRALADYLERHPRAGLAGPRLENPDGTLQRSCFDFLGTARLAIEKSPLGRRLASIPALRDRWLIHHGPHDRPRTAASIRVSFFMPRRSTSATGCGRPAGRSISRRPRRWCTWAAPARHRGGRRWRRSAPTAPAASTAATTLPCAPRCWRA